MGDDGEDLDEKLDRDRHGSGEFDPEERYGRRGVEPDRRKKEPGDEDSSEDDSSEDDSTDDDSSDNDSSDEDSSADD